MIGRNTYDNQHAETGTQDATDDTHRGGFKQKLDGNGQKVKAVRYIAGLGCEGCCPDAEQSLLAALEDECSEEVRRSDESSLGVLPAQ